MKNIILTVQPSNDKWRLGLNKSDSLNYFNHRETVILHLSNIKEFSIKTACGTSRKKAFDFNGKIIDYWIKKNNYHKYEYRKPTKLIFELIDDFQLKKIKFIKKSE